MWLAQLESLRPALAAWTQAVQRSMDEYAAHPTAVCQRPACDRLAATGGLCHGDERDRRTALQRSQARRDAKAGAA